MGWDIGFLYNWLVLFGDEKGHTITIESERYVEMLYDPLLPKLPHIPDYYQRTWFQQDLSTTSS